MVKSEAQVRGGTFQEADLTLTVRPLLVSVHFILNRKLLFVCCSFAFLDRPKCGKMERDELEWPWLWLRQRERERERQERILPVLCASISLSSSWSHGWVNSNTLCPVRSIYKGKKWFKTHKSCYYLNLYDIHNVDYGMYYSYYSNTQCNHSYPKYY